MQVIDSIYSEPEKWTVGPHYFVHENGTSIWCANGLCFFQLETGGSFNFVQKLRAWMAYRWWLNNAPMEAFGRK